MLIKKGELARNSITYPKAPPFGLEVRCSIQLSYRHKIVR